MHSVRGGARRDRTADPLLAKQVLSQLSYGPLKSVIVVGLGGFEPPTSPLSGVRSSHLSYRPEVGLLLRSSNLCWMLVPGLLEAILKGGDPAAGSPTATLLRLHPSH